ncbi:MAG TPA: metallophosphoesterase [Tepidisphaeraceae bacterium]|jgi:3',5'-cyclic AMP phosphodiesterase CpdA
MDPSPHHKYGRRDVLRWGAGAALYSSLIARWATAADNAKDSGTFTFVVINDIHYFDQRCATWLNDRVIRRVNDHKADFCLIVGDLTEDGTKPQNAAVKDVLNGIRIPTYVVVGNHDHQAGNDDRTPYEANWPKSINYHFEHKGWQFIGLDSCQGRAGSKTVVPKDTIAYLIETLKSLDKKKPTALFTHFPLGYFLPSRPTNANDLLLPFAEHTLLDVFNGHFHSKTERAWGDATLTTNTCCSFHRANHDFDPRKGYFLCTAKNGRIHREYVQVNANG